MTFLFHFLIFRPLYQQSAVTSRHDVFSSVECCACAPEPPLLSSVPNKDRLYNLTSATVTSAESL